MAAHSQAPRLLQAFAARPVIRAPKFGLSRSLATTVDIPPIGLSSRKHKVVIAGGGSAGQFASEDIALVDPAEWHHYQPGWTLVGGGLKNKDDLKKQLGDMINPKIRFYNAQVHTFRPDEHTLSLQDGAKLSYEQLVICPGLKVDFNSIHGRRDAIADPHAPVSSIYSYETCDKTAQNISEFSKGNALFTHPTGPVKCARAPQKIMWFLGLPGSQQAGTP